MRRRAFPGTIFAIACCLLTAATPAQAVSAETWVSATGTPGPCTLADPCRTFQQAHAQTTNGGTINVLTPGNFGPVTISKGISIVADGVEAVINTAAGGAAIKIQAAATAVVSLRGLTIEGVADNDGISFVSGAALHVHNCFIRRTGGTGIFFAPASGIRELTVADTIIANPGSSGIGIVPSGSAGAKAVIERVSVKHAFNTGITVAGSSTSGSINVTVRDSVSAGGESSGIRASDNAPGTTAVTVDRSAAVNNAGAGIFAVGAAATIQIGDSTVSGNGIGLSIGGGTIESYGTNKVDGNDNDVDGTIGTATYK